MADSVGPVAFKSAVRFSKGAQKLQGDNAWVDDQIQPLPRAVRKRFHDWVRAEELGKTLYDAEVVIFDDNGSGKMSCAEIQFSHYQVLQMSSFCRRVLSMCYILERAEDFTVEHQWENFVFNMPPEGWRARYHIYSPGLKYGGGQQHRPTLSKNGCYLVRLFYIGAWRCVWVSDQVPVDPRECPLLPFAPSFNQNSLKPERVKQAATISQTQTVVLWPLLICKALLKLAAPRMDSDDYSDNYADEPFNDFDILHALTGAMNLTYVIDDADQLWKRICEEVPQYTWDDDDETLTSTIKTKTKKPSNKEVLVFKHRSLTSVLIGDTGNVPPYTLPGITPAFQMELLVVMSRDLPLKKPLPEPEVALWKHYRWIDWAKKHGLYEAFDCPRTRFLKMSALLKLSLAPHLLDVQSTDSVKKSAKAINRSTTTNQTMSPQLKEELRDWVQFEAVQKFIKNISCLYYPSMYQFCSIASNPPVRITKLSANKEIDVPASKTSPIYLQIDGPDQNCLRISCGMIHPRVLLHAGMPKGDYVEPGYVLVEKFDWFDDCELPKSKAYLQTRGYDGTEVTFQPGRHYCRLWIHSRVPWHVMLVSDSTIHVGTRDVIQVAALRECPWASKFLNSLGAAFQNFMRTNKSTTTISSTDRDFYKSYLPDLEWDPKIVGQSRSHLHWMFRQALQSLLKKKLSPFDYRLTCRTLRYCFDDPEFGLFKKTASFVTAKDLIIDDPCFCPTDTEELEIFKMNYNELMKGSSDNDVHPSDDLLPRVCEAARENMPCGTLKTLRDIIIRRHEAATRIQALWRGIRARDCVRTRVAVSPEIFKCLMDNAFGNLEALAALMNEFFKMFPGAKSAFSVASALTGSYSLKQHFGIVNVTPRCVWIPLFQGVFYCHAPVKVHLDLQSTMGTKKINSTVGVYDNDTRRQLPLMYTAHTTLNLTPNSEGYTVLGHATFQQAPNITSEVHWQLNVMSSLANAFHICDNELDGCRELPMLSATKLHVDEIFVPNERNILGGIQITVSRHESISFRASATSDDLEMVAILQVMTSDGKVKEIEKCYGQGELYWPYIRLELLSSGLQVKSMSQADVTTPQSEPLMFGSRSQRNVRYGRPATMSAGIKTRSTVKIKEQRVPQDLTTYIIEVRAPKGWPLSLAQWKRVIDVQNKQDYRSGTQSKKSFKEKDKITKDKDKIDVPSSYLQFGDAYVELECSLGGDTGTVAKRDDTRDQRFAMAVKSWEGKELGRNTKGALIRQEFRKEFLENITISKVVFIDESSIEAMESAEIEKETLSYLPRNQQGPTPAESPVSATQVDYKYDGTDMTVKDTKTEAKFLFMPDELKDKFKPLDFIKSCTRERTEDERVILTSEMLEAGKKGREMGINTAYERMNQLQTYNEVQVLEAQKTRCDLLETLFVDSQWCPALAEALEARDNTVVPDILNKSASVMRRKQDIKTK